MARTDAGDVSTNGKASSNGKAGKASKAGKGEVVFGLRAANVNPVNPADLIPKPTVRRGPAVFEHAPTHFLYKRLLQVCAAPWPLCSTSAGARRVGPCAAFGRKQCGFGPGAFAYLCLVCGDVTARGSATCLW